MNEEGHSSVDQPIYVVIARLMIINYCWGDWVYLVFRAWLDKVGSLSIFFPRTSFKCCSDMIGFLQGNLARSIKKRVCRYDTVVACVTIGIVTTTLPITISLHQGSSVSRYMLV